MVAVIDNRMDSNMVKKLGEMGYKTVMLPEFKNLAGPVSAHPDMLIFIIGDTLITSSSYYNVAKTQIDEILKLSNLKLITEDIELKKDYPKDICYNAFIVGKYLVGNIKYLSNTLKQKAEELGYALISVKQGYAKCSVLKVDENSIITADTGIYNALSKADSIDILKISDNGALLQGYNNGFIGGATGSDKDNVYFCGDISLHPDYEKIKDFCNLHGKKVVNLKENTPLYDYGTVFLI